MKRVLLSLALFLGMCSLVHAGTPQDINPVNGPYSYNSFFGNFSPVANSTYTLPSLGTSLGTSSNQPGRYCFDHILVLAPAFGSVYVIDNATFTTTSANTNSIYIPGAGLTVPINMTWPHLEPLCFPGGDSVSFVVTGSSSTFISWDGFTTAARAGGSSDNRGL